MQRFFSLGQRVLKYESHETGKLLTRSLTMRRAINTMECKRFLRPLQLYVLFLRTTFRDLIYINWRVINWDPQFSWITINNTFLFHALFEVTIAFPSLEIKILWYLQLQFFRIHKPRTGAPVDLRFRSRGRGIELSFGKFIDGNVDACLFLHAKTKLPLKDAPNAMTLCLRLVRQE